MHCIDRNRDRGGNSGLVFYPPRREAVSLHFVWDSLIVRDLVGKQKIAIAAKELAKKISRTELKHWEQYRTPEQWANESHLQAAGWAYLSIDEKGPPPKLGQTYMLKATSVVTAQIQKGV
jgi:hypothetical protein